MRSSSDAPLKRRSRSAGIACCVLLSSVSWMVAGAAQGHIFKQKVTVVGQDGKRSLSTREIGVLRKQGPKPGTKKLTGQAMPGKAAVNAAGPKKIRPYLLPGYPNAAINSQYFGSTAVGQTSSTITLTYPYPSGVTEQTLTFAAGLNGFFGQATCNYPQSCTAPIAFQPTYPGLTTNAVISKDQNGNIIYETLIYAMGTAPQLGFDLGDLTNHMAVTNQPDSVAVGPDGSLYLTDASQDIVYQIASDFSSQTQLAITGLGTPGGIAVDGAETLYIADKTNNVIVAYNQMTGGQVTVPTSQLSNPSGVAVDGSGDLFIADTGNNRILLIDPQGNETTYASNLAAPTSIATDSSGNVYYADSSNGGEITQLMDGSTTIGTQLGTLYDMAVDAAGTVYVSTQAGLTLIYANGSNTQTYVFGGGPNYGMALDAAGDVITTQPANGSVSITNRSASNFILTTEVGTTTSGGDIIANTGNSPLTLSNIAISGTVFTADDSTECFSNLTIQPGLTCTLVVDFSPTEAQNYQETYTVTSNSLNVSTSMNADALSGNGTGVPTATALSVSPSPAITGQTLVLTATVTRSGGGSDEPSPTGTVNFLDGTTLLGSADLSSGGDTAQFSTSSLAAGTHSITAQYAGDSVNAPSSNVQSLLVTAGNASSTQLTSTPASPAAGQNVTFTVSVSGTTQTTVATGTVTLTNAGGTLATITLDDTGQGSFSTTHLAPGNYSVTGNYSGDATYSPSASGVDSFTVSPPVATTTTLSVTSGGSAVTTVASGSVVTLTAAVVVGTAPVSPAQVAFCDATAASCTDGHLLGTAQVTSAGTASYSFVPSIGSHSYKAVFLGTLSKAGSSSNTKALAVTGTYPTTTTIAQSGAAGNYTLTGTVAGSGSRTLSPAGTVSFRDTTASPATVLGTAALGTAALGFIEAQATGSPVAASSEPVEIASGDFNGDGLADLAVVNNQDMTVGIFLGNGDGTFQAQVTYATNGNDPGTVRVADFNGDGHLDLAVVNFDDGTVSVLLGNGDGTFQAEQTYSVGQDTAGLAVMDLNHDGIPDIVVGEGAFQTGYGAAGVLLGKGDGTFSALTSYTAGANAIAVAEGDFNGDGNVDIVTASYDDATVSILLGNGDGTFQTQVAYPVGSHPIRVQVGDFNGDGIPDLAVSNFVDSTVSVLLGNGDGTFQPQVTYAIGSEPDGLVLADVDGDGNVDIAVSNNAGDTIGILLGKGDGTFQTQVTYPTGDEPGGLAAGDFNGDGFPDLAVANLGDNTATILLSEITETATATATGVSPTGPAIHQVVASYPGNANYRSSVSAATPLMGPGGSQGDTPSSTALTLSASTITVSQPVMLTVTVTGPAGYPTPTGTATFYNGTAVLGTGTLNSSGVTTYTSNALTFAAGSYSLTAIYGGDTVYAGSTSPAQPLTVTAGGLTLTPATLPFGNQMVGTTSAAQQVTVTNPGATTINISQIASELGANPAEFIQTNNCPAALVQNASCTLNIAFAPTAVGAASAGVSISDDSTPQEQFVAVTGTGTGGVLQVNPGNLKTIAGDGTLGDTGDGGQATAAELTQPNGIAFDPSGNLYIADDVANVVRKVDTKGVITTFAGNGTGGYTGDGGAATAAELFQPFSVASDAAGNIYIEDTGNYVIRKVDTTGTITTFAGTGAPGHSGDGGPAIDAKFNQNQGARFDTAGNLYVPTCFGASVRKIDTAGNITTVAGNFTEGYSGDGGAATSAQLQCPSGVTIDAAGNFYIADEGNQVIRKVDTNGIITTVAGSTAGTAGFAGDGGPATAALFNLPNDVVLDPSGNLYVADSANNRVRMIDTSGKISTLAGGLSSAGSAGVNTPLGLTVDSAGKVYFSDSGNGAVREVLPQGTTPFPATPVGMTAIQTVSLSNIGNVTITIPSSDGFTLGGNASDFALTGGTCLQGTTLAGGQGSCTLQISFTPTAVGLRTLAVSIADDALNSPQSFTIGGLGTLGTPALTWTPPASIVYGTALSTTQLDATATGATGTVLAGTFVYTPAAGTILDAGTQTLSATFTPTDNVDYATATITVPITVMQATPTLTWATPAAIAYGTALSATQLDATVTGVSGTTALPGTFTYTPALGTILAPGTHMLSVAFAPTDAVDYTAATGTVNLTVAGLSVAAITPTTLVQGSGDTPITLTGVGFVSTSIVQVNGAAVATTYVSPTSLTAVIPAADLTTVATLQVTVFDPSIEATSTAQPLMVLPATVAVTLTAPPTAAPGSQPSVALTITNPYPLDLTAVFTLTFAAKSGPAVDDPAIQFAGGGRTFTIIVPANSTVVPPVGLQSGTDAGTITIAVDLTAGGQDVTPTGLAPVLIDVPAVVPVLTTATVTRSGDQLTVVIHGFSNTREVAQAAFAFTGATGETLGTPDVTIPATTLFGGWYSTTESLSYGSTFTYTQIFNVSDAATSVASVKVTLTNSVGVSLPQASQ